ncbi:MAG: DUF2953 domain-containing protein [Oscillospiraceae bacterium]
MSILLETLKILGIILLSLLALVIAALFLRITARICYEKDVLTVRVGALGLRFKIFDSSTPEKVKNKKPKIPDTPDEREQQEIRAKKHVIPDLDTICALLGAGAGSAAHILRRIRIRHVMIVFVAFAGDPCATGMLTGAIWQSLGSFITSLALVCHDITYDELVVIPDFMGEHEGEERFGCELSAKPVIALAAGIILLFRYLKFKSRQAVEARGDKATERMCAE